VTTAAYVRISSDPTGKALGIERQEAEIRSWASAHGLTIDHVYSDNDFSATTGKRRPGFEQLLADSPAVVVVWHQDRLLRVSKDLERVLDAGFVVHQVTAGSLDLATPTGKAIARTITAWATFEGEHKSERQRAANRQRRASGLRHGGGQRAFGYTQDGLETVPGEREAVTAAYQQVLAGRSLKSLAAEWNEMGLTTTFGNPWRPTGVRSVLQNPVNAGRAVYDGEDLGTGRWPALVDEASFAAVRALLADPSRRTTTNGARKHFLPGLLRCGRCGAVMSSGWTAKRIRTYVCANRHLSRSAAPVDAFVTEAVLSRLETADIPTVAPESPAAEVEQLRARLGELADAYASDAITLTQMTRASDTLRERLDRAEAALARSHGDDVLKRMTGDVRQVWEELDIEQRRAVVMALMEPITLLSAGRGARTFDPETVQIVWH
jgi:site-specific DNA recombinase